MRVEGLLRSFLVNKKSKKCKQDIWKPSCQALPPYKPLGNHAGTGAVAA